MHPYRLTIAAVILCALCGPAVGAAFTEIFDKMPSGWEAMDQPWVLVTDPDPLKPTNKVLHVESLDGHIATLIMARRPLGDGTLHFRTRFETPFRSIASADKNDGVHFPHWRVNLMPGVDGSALVFIDNHVWANMELSENSQTKITQAGTRPQSTWIDWNFTFTKGVCSVTQDGRAVLKSEYTPTSCSGLSLTVMHGKLWLDDVSFKP